MSNTVIEIGQLRLMALKNRKKKMAKILWDMAEKKYREFYGRP